MITRETLDEIDARLSKGYPIPIEQVAGMATMLRSHPAISLLGSPSEPSPQGSLCTFPECHCARACADYVRARG